MDPKTAKPATITKPEDREKLKRANDIMARAYAMYRVRERYSRAWLNYEKMWKMIAEKKTGEDEWRSSLPDTWGFATVKTAQSAFVDSKVTPIIIRHPDDPSTKAQDLRDLYTDVGEKGNLDQELYYLRLDSFKLGNGYGKTVYVKDTRMVWEIKSFDPDTDEFKWEKKEIKEFDDPKTIRVSPYLMLVDDLARADWNGVRDVIEVEVLGRDEAEARYGNLVDFKRIPQTTYLLQQLKVSASTQVAETDGTGLRGTEFEFLQKYAFFAPGFDWSNDVVEILHYWNQGIKTPSGCLDSYEILINGYPAKVDTKNKPEPIPYIHKKIPYFHVPYSPYSGDEHYAMGIIEIGYAEARALQAWREAQVDREKIAMFSPAWADVTDDIDQRQLKLKPLMLIRSKGGVPHQWQIPGVNNATFALQDRFELAYKRATGIDERILGLQSTGSRLTATEINLLRESAMRRLREFSFLYKNTLLQWEIKFKFSLFKQYYSNPLKKESKVKDDKGIRILKVEYKKFKVKTNNIYTEKEIMPNFFEGEIDTDLDLQILLPMTPAQMTTMWSQILRDAVPFVQAGVIDISLKKVFEKYIESLGTNPESLKEDKTALAINMAEAEHKLYADPNTASKMDQILPEGTPKQYLTQEHILKHEELMDNDLNIEDSEKKYLLDHIKKDIDNFGVMQAQQAGPNLAGLTPQAMATVGGLPHAAQPTVLPATTEKTTNV